MDREVPRAISRLPLAPGVYRFRDAVGEVLYIGRATTLRSRVASYWSDLRDRGHLTPMVARVARVEAVACDSAHEAAWLERNLLEEARPRWNRTASGQESPVYLRLDARPRSPGLTVAWRPQPGDGLRYFGPYLGGLRARLEELRGAAAEALAFELAGKINSELRSLDWVTSPQRVTALEPADFEACGWSGQLLVRFVVRAGRLCDWSQERCDRAAATAGLAATPPGWAGFARRGAELAAALSA